MDAQKKILVFLNYKSVFFMDLVNGYVHSTYVMSVDWKLVQISFGYLVVE